MVIATKTDQGPPAGWYIDDAVVQLRRWGTESTRELPAMDGEWTIGAREDSWLRIEDPEHRVSKQHALLTRVAGRWTITDLASRNGIRQDGERRLSFPLVPGVEIGIGGVTLVGESVRLIRLRELLCRLIGWSDAARGEVDLALRVARMAALRRGSLFICGDGDLTVIARLVHGHTIGPMRPFVVCDPRRQAVRRTARAAANYVSGTAALVAAEGGTLCVWQNHYPADFADVLASVREPDSRVQLVVCTHNIQPGDPLIASPVILPSLVDRATELDRVIDAFGEDATSALGGSFTEADREWIRQEEASTLAQVEIAAYRLVALRAERGSITRAAKRLSMSHSALSEWTARRTLPT